MKENDTEGLQGVPLDLGYSSGYGSLVEEFYQPCLERAVRYDRSVGFFRSSFYAITAVAYTDFAKKGGKVRLVCSPRLTDEDWAAIEAGYGLEERSRERLRETVDVLLEERIGSFGVRFLACLISANTLNVRIAVPRQRGGVFHEKLGIFADQIGNTVSFIGSPNETYLAWDEAGNYESLEVFKSWQSSESESRTRRHAKYFEKLWSGSEPAVRIFKLPEEIRDVLVREAQGTTVGEAQKEFVRVIRETVPLPSGQNGDGSNPGPYELQEHQADTVASWMEAGFRGIVKHATGAGKTVTALEVVKRWIEEGRSALITVPTIVLQEQWQEELKRHLSDLDYRLLLAGGSSGRRQWIDHLADFTCGDSAFGPRVVIGLIQTVSGDAFLRRCQDGDHLLVVADEVHVTGAPTFQRLFKVDAGARLGLSATPTRYGDPEGTKALREYFGPILSPVITLTDAIDAGRLVPYYYHVHPVHLTEEEQNDWDLLSEKIASEYARLPEKPDGGKQHSEHLKFLLIKRARILKQAKRKVSLALRVLSESYSEDERWLIYCDDTSQLNSVCKSLRSDGHEVIEYHSAMESDRNAVMSYFAYNACIMVAIKCLDEGVDLPAANGALILASSSNPREFIQRRGRVLRRAKGKHAADVHDVIVLPSERQGESGPSREGIIATELRRALIFAEGASNRSCEIELREMARTAGVELDELEIDDYAFEAD